MKPFIDAMKIARDSLEAAARELQNGAQEVDVQIKVLETQVKKAEAERRASINAVIQGNYLLTESPIPVSQRAREIWYQDMLKRLDSDSNRYAPFSHGMKNAKSLKEMGVGTLEHEVEWLIDHEEELFKRLTKPTNYMNAHDWLITRPMVLKMLAEIDHRS